MSPPERRIEDRIRYLCAKVATAPDGDLETALRELSQLLRGTIEHMRESATKLLVEGTPLPEPRRRANDNPIAKWDEESLQRDPSMGAEEE